ncbi:hypothetical protein [Calothrix sp. PCC 6303]|nr:hypothetical protein [Calothrix sp. PCC 6303]
MGKDLTQEWLGEIQGLKQQLAELQNARNEAWESAEKWRKLYNTEAEQRRTDNQLAQQAIASLNGQLQKIKGIDDKTLPDADTSSAIHAEVIQLQSVEELQTKLIAATKERDRLLLALKTEQEEHAKTRTNLTTALGDAIDGMKQRS